MKVCIACLVVLLGVLAQADGVKVYNGGAAPLYRERRQMSDQMKQILDVIRQDVDTKCPKAAPIIKSIEGPLKAIMGILMKKGGKRDLRMMALRKDKRFFSFNGFIKIAAIKGLEAFKYFCEGHADLADALIEMVKTVF